MPDGFTLSPIPHDLPVLALIEWHYTEGDRAPVGSPQRAEHYRQAAELAASEAARKARNAKKRRREVRRA